MVELSSGSKYRSASALFAVVPLLGLLVVVFDTPDWVKLGCIVLMLGLVGAGSRLLRGAKGGASWLPSETLSRTGADARKERP